MVATPNKGYEAQATGANVGTWGTVLNDNMISYVDDNLGGITTLALTNVNVSLTASQARSAILRLTGTLTGAVQITSACIGFFFVENLTTGSFAVTITNGVSGVVITQGFRTLCIADGTNGVRTLQNSVANGGTGASTATAGFDNLAPTTTRGDIIVRGASVNQRLALGTTGYVIQSDGTDAVYGQIAAAAFANNTIPYAAFANAATAAQTDMEAASSTVLIVTPGNVQYHPGVAKSTLCATVSGGVPSIANSYNVPSITDVSTGIMGVTIGTDYSSANWTCNVGVQVSSTENNAYINTGTQTAGAVQLENTTSGASDSGTPADPVVWYMSGHGDQ